MTDTACTACGTHAAACYSLRLFGKARACCGDCSHDDGEPMKAA